MPIFNQTSPKKAEILGVVFQSLKNLVKSIRGKNYKVAPPVATPVATHVATHVAEGVPTGMPIQLPIMYPPPQSIQYVQRVATQLLQPVHPAEPNMPSPTPSAQTMVSNAGETPAARRFKELEQVVL